MVCGGGTLGYSKLHTSLARRWGLWAGEAFRRHRVFVGVGVAMSRPCVVTDELEFAQALRRKERLIDVRVPGPSRTLTLTEPLVVTYCVRIISSNQSVLAPGGADVFEVVAEKGQLYVEM